MADRLPVMTVARLECALRLIQRMVDEKTELFVERGQDFRERYRDGASRPLAADELAAVAAGLSVDLDEAQRQVDAAGLVHRPDPTPQEVMFAAGAATAPEFLEAVMRVVALIEMPASTLEALYDDELALDDELLTAVDDLRRRPVPEVRQRAIDALATVGEAIGDQEGKVLGLVWRAITQALDRSATVLGETWQTASSIGSAPRTAGPERTSSTGSPGGEPAA